MKNKIIFLIADLGGGGAEKVLVNLVNALPINKYDITIRTIFGKGVNAQYLAPHIRYSSLFPCKMIGGYVFASKLLPPRWLYKLLVRGKYDIEVAYMMHVPSRAIGASDSSAKKYAWSHILHITSNAYRSKKEFMNSYRNFNGIAFVSRDGLNDFNKNYFQHPYGRVVHNVVDSQYIMECGKESVTLNLDELVINICSVGRLCSQKGYLRLVKVLGELYAEGFKRWHLYLLGKGEDQESIVALAMDLGISHLVTLLGFHSNPHKYVSKMDLFVCSSETEGYSTAVTESIILGIPVLTTDCSGMNEIIGDSGAGMVVHNTNDGLKDGLRKVLLEPHLIKEMKLKAAERSKAFETQKLVSEFEDFINGKA